MEGMELRTESTKVIPSLQEQKQYWDQRWEKESTPSQWQIRQGEAIYSLLKKIPKENLNIFDLGCGTGWMTNQVKEFGQVRGMDLSESAIAIARSRYPAIEFAAEDFFATRMSPNTFDLVIAQEVIAHVENQHLLISKISDILKPNGYLILTTVNKTVINRMDLGLEPKGHIKQWLNKGDIKRICQHRFKVLKNMTVNPVGNKGFLRIVNSYKLNKFLQCFASEKTIEKLKEYFGFGYTRVVLLQKI